MKNELLMRAVEVLQREFGDDWQTIVQSLGTENLRRRVGKELTSFIAFPDRGCGGSNIWRGNCSPKVVEAVAKYVMDAKRYYGKSISTRCRAAVHLSLRRIISEYGLFCMT